MRASSRRALADVSLPNAVVQEVRAGDVSVESGAALAGVIAGARQDRDRRQAHRLCVHRPAMLAAGDGPGGAGGDHQGRPPSHLRLSFAAGFEQDLP